MKQHKRCRDKICCQYHSKTYENSV